jgi:glutaredoxin-related protein
MYCFRLSVITALLSFLSWFSHAETLELVLLFSDNKPPYMITNQETLRISGVDYDVMQAVSSDTNLKVAFIPLPSGRLSRDTIDGLDRYGNWVIAWSKFGTQVFQEYLPTKFTMSLPVYTFGCVKISNNNSPYANSTDYSGARIVRTRGLEKKSLSQILGTEDFYLTGVESDESALRMVKLDRADISFMEKFSFYWAAQKTEILVEEFSVNDCPFWEQDDSIVYLLSPSIDDATVNKINASIISLNKTGRMKKIILKYLPQMQ